MYVAHSSNYLDTKSVVNMWTIDMFEEISSWQSVIIIIHHQLYVVQTQMQSTSLHKAVGPLTRAPRPNLLLQVIVAILSQLHFYYSFLVKSNLSLQSERSALESSIRFPFKPQVHHTKLPGLVLTHAIVRDANLGVCSIILSGSVVVGC